MYAVWAEGTDGEVVQKKAKVSQQKQATGMEGSEWAAVQSKSKYHEMIIYQRMFVFWRKGRER